MRANSTIQYLKLYILMLAERSEQNDIIKKERMRKREREVIFIIHMYMLH